MKGIISSKIAVSVLFAVCVGAFTAQANLLLYDGFATETDSQSRQPYSTAKTDNSLTGDNAKSVAYTTGLSADKPWSEQSSVVYSFRARKLLLPSAFAAGTGDQFTARDGGAGYKYSNAPDGELRAKNRAITSTMPTTGKLYYRCLMKIESSAFNALKDTSWRYVSTGISASVATNAYDNQAALRDKGLRIAFIGRSDSFAVGIYINIGTNQKVVVSSAVADATYVCIVELNYDTAKAKAYVAPIDNYSTAFTWTLENIDIPSAVATSAMKVMFLDGSYKTNSGYVIFDEIAVGTALSDVAVVAEPPALGDVSLSRTGAATYSVSAKVEENPADTVYWIADDGTTATTNSFAASVTNTTAAGTVSDLAAGKTYQISVLAKNSDGADEKVAGTIYTGELSLGATTNAYEYDLVAGGVMVSRANADPWPLTVNYTISGSAGSEGTTWAAPVAVTIPANAASAMLPVVPLKDGSVTADVTITVALADGNYEIPATDSKALTLFNLAPPSGKKTWTASAAGNASDGANWTPAGAPASTDEILFAGAFSNARCYWDADATHTMASWTQDSDFTGTVEIQTTYDNGAFPVLNITSNCTVNGGKITQKNNSNQQLYRISLSIGGDFATATGTEITAQGKGFAKGYYHEGSAIGVHGGSINDISKVYGDFKHPMECGSGGNSDGMAGGGAIHIVVTGSSTVDGKIIANPTWEEKTLSYGAAGSVYIQTASLSGSGEINALGWGNAGSTAKHDGAGGRVAIILTSANALDFPKNKISTRGTIGGYGRTSGGGTIFVKTANQQNGTLIIINEDRKDVTNVQYWPTKRGVTPIPAGETWTLDALEFRGTGVLCVPAGTTLNVPIANISAAGDRISGILYEGGTINFGSAPYMMANKWVFQADVPYTFNGDVTVTNGASIGCLRFSGSLIDGSNENGAKSDDYAVCDVTVNGNLTIASGGYASAEMGGPCGNAGTGGRGDSGGFYSRHGGQYAPQPGNHCYGSVFNPVLPGQFAQCGDHATIGVGGGALKLTVTGDLVVDGRITADGGIRHKSSAPAGSVNITAGTLSGSGSITATGNPGSIQWDSGYNGVGGRIAVRVTGEDVGTTGIWSKFAALGCATNQVVANGAIVAHERNQNTSAGTIYLQGMSDGEKGGTIYVKNQASYHTSNVATWIPAATRGDGAKDFAKAKLVIADRGVVAVGTNRLAVASVSIATNSKVNLAGNVLTVRKAYLNGVSLAAGEYTSESSAVTGYVVDSVGGGKLIVGGGFFVVVR